MVWLKPKMSIANKTSKENFRLLDLSSEEESDDLHLEIIPRKKKVTRRGRNKTSTTKLAEPNLGTEIQCALRWAMRGTLLLWLLMLTWICASLYDQVSTMNLDMTKVKESSHSVGDSLQFCHTAAQQLRANASDLGDRLGRLEQLYRELALRVDEAGGEAAAVAQQLASAPQLVDTPRRLAELQRTVADFGSQINSFESSLNTAHQLSTDVKEVKKLVTQVQERSNYALGNATDSVRKGEELRVELAALKESLKAMQTTPATPSTTAATTASTTTSTTAATSTTSSTTTPPPEPPAKPAVLQ